MNFSWQYWSQSWRTGSSIILGRNFCRSENHCLVSPQSYPSCTSLWNLP